MGLRGGGSAVLGGIGKVDVVSARSSGVEIMDSRVP